MSQVGYYRYKIDNLTEGEYEIPLFINGGVAVTHTVKILPICTGGKRIKYLDKNGQYRFFAFNKYWQGQDSPKLIGTSNKLITSILDSQSNKNVIGYKNDRILNLVADDVDEDKLDLLTDLWTSPRVYLYVGTTGDEEKDWIKVQIKGDNTTKRRKLISGTLNVEVTLPEWFSITML